MTEYIGKDSAIAVLEARQKDLCPLGRYGRGYVYGKEREQYDAWEEIIGEVSAIPAADVVPVVRCRECVHCRLTENWDRSKFLGCHRLANICIPKVQPEDFCSCGEKDEI